MNQNALSIANSNESDVSQKIQKIQYVDDTILNDLGDKYIKVDGVSLSLPQPVDSFHKQYFSVLLKKQSFDNVLCGKAPLDEEYSEFYREQMAPKLKGLRGIFSSPKLPESDAAFFSNLKLLSSYMKGDSVNNIGEVIDDIKSQRDDAEVVLQGRHQRRLSEKQEKNRIMYLRLHSLEKEFNDYARTDAGTQKMILVTDNFVEGVLAMYKDMSIKMPDDVNQFFADETRAGEAYVSSKEELFQTALRQYYEVLKNPNLPEKREAIGKINALTEKIFGHRQELVRSSPKPPYFRAVLPDVQVNYEIRN